MGRSFEDLLVSFPGFDSIRVRGRRWQLIPFTTWGDKTGGIEEKANTLAIERLFEGQIAFLPGRPWGEKEPYVSDEAIALQTKNIDGQWQMWGDPRSREVKALLAKLEARGGVVNQGVAMRLRADYRDQLVGRVVKEILSEMEFSSWVGEEEPRAMDIGQDHIEKYGHLEFTANEARFRGAKAKRRVMEGIRLSLRNA